MMATRAWRTWQLVTFRFGTVLAALFTLPWLLNLVDYRLARLVMRPWTQLVLWFAEHVLGIGRPPTVSTGSGDTLFAWTNALAQLIVAALVCAVWSILDRRRAAYVRLAELVGIALRHVLGFVMLLYAVAKIAQFSYPNASRLDGTIGEMSPMGLLWTFMGYSTPYTVFAAISEGLAGALLLWRRTAVAGALLAIAVLGNIVMLNMSYDVPVKLFAMQLLVIALAIAGPHLRRVIGAVLGHATREVPPRPRMSPTTERVRTAIKVGVLGLMALRLYAIGDQMLAWRRESNPLEAIWVVETWRADGVEHAPLITDPVRWRKLAINARYLTVRLMTDERRLHAVRVDPERHTMTVSGQTLPEIWRYAQRDEDHLAIEGSYRGQHVEVTLRREPDGLLVTRGFHWIQEAPFNR
ncbi:MAG TPA: hypothetical protein VFQ53_07935 [Kofleriaceae bacterium]|nr:hypothetical protein [Kofleriaceae bacterium]